VRGPANRLANPYRGYGKLVFNAERDRVVCGIVSHQNCFYDFLICIRVTRFPFKSGRAFDGHLEGQQGTCGCCLGIFSLQSDLKDTVLRINVL
jgi:hypothetical protein